LHAFADIVEAITPHKLLGLRQLLNSSAMDIMYYTSPLYGCEVRCGSGLIQSCMLVHMLPVITHSILASYRNIIFPGLEDKVFYFIFIQK